MDIRPIRTDEDHRAALAEIAACWGAPEGSEGADKLDVLVALVESYEDRRWPIEPAARFDPIDVLHHAINELGHTQTELAELLGSRSRASEILGRRRAHGRDDPQDRRSVEDSNGSAGAAVRDRECGVAKAGWSKRRPLPVLPRKRPQAREGARVSAPRAAAPRHASNRPTPPAPRPRSAQRRRQPAAGPDAIDIGIVDPQVGVAVQH